MRGTRERERDEKRERERGERETRERSEKEARETRREVAFVVVTSRVGGYYVGMG